MCTGKKEGGVVKGGGDKKLICIETAEMVNLESGKIDILMVKMPLEKNVWGAVNITQKAFI